MNMVSDNRKIGIGLSIGGMFFTVLGIMLFFDRGLLGLTIDQRMAAMQKFDETLFSNAPYAWLAQQVVVCTMDGESRRVQSLLVGAPAHVRLPRR